MKKLFSLAFALASCALIPSVAKAALCEYEVSIVNGHDRVCVGDWELSLDEESYNKFLHADACRFFVSWTNNAVLSSSTDLRIDELTQNEYTDCEENQDKSFTTVVVLADGKKHKGFNKFQQKKSVTLLALGEDDKHGDLFGVIQFGNYDLYPFEAKADDKGKGGGGGGKDDKDGYGGGGDDDKDGKGGGGKGGGGKGGGGDDDKDGKGGGGKGGGGDDKKD